MVRNCLRYAHIGIADEAFAGAGDPGVVAPAGDSAAPPSAPTPLWGAPGIHGELLKLGIDVSQATVSKHMIGRRGPPSQTWRTFLENPAGEMIVLDFFAVPTATFRVLVVLSHDRLGCVDCVIVLGERRPGCASVGRLTVCRSARTYDSRLDLVGQNVETGANGSG